jgi:hypothetical protein
MGEEDQPRLVKSIESCARCRIGAKAGGSARIGGRFPRRAAEYECFPLERTC